MEIVIGIPAYNEENNIAIIIAKLHEITKNIIVCNDGSSDMTGIIAEEMGAIVVNHHRNMGYGASIRSIFQKADELHFDALVTFDADGQHQVKDIKPVLDPILKDEADIVIGSRFLGKEAKNIPGYRKVGIKALTGVANVATDSKITDSQSGFRAYGRNVIKDIVPSEYGMSVSTEILIKASKKGLRIKEVPITVLYEGDTSTHNPMSHGIAVFLGTMKFISIEHPLKFYGVPGLGFLAVGLFFIIWTLQAFATTRMIITNIALISVGCTIVGTMLVMTSIMLYSLVNVVRERHH